jgi:hypothetical protein
VSEQWWWYATEGGGPGPVDRSIAMTGAGQLAQVGGPLISRPGETIPEMRALLYHRPNINTPVADLVYALGHTFQTRHKELGTGEVELLNTDADLAQVWDHECCVRFEIMGRAAFTMIVNELNHTAIAEGEEHDQRTKLSGRAHISCLEESVVYPPNGHDAKPFADDRIFSWPSPDYNDTWWGAADLLVTQAPGALVFPGGGTRPPLLDDTGANGSYWENAVTEGWPDPTAWWIWAHWPNSREWAPEGTCYFRRKFTTDAATAQVLMYVILDDGGEVWFDGIGPVIEPTYGIEPTGLYTYTVDVTPGVHTLAIKATNDPPDPARPDRHNPGGVLFTCYGIDALGGFSGTGPIFHSDDGWSIVEYPPQPPGMTPGEVIRHVIQEGQARGCFPEITLAFDDTFDSAGKAWPITGDISTKIGTNCWTFVGEELAATYVDVWMSPGDFMLHAWIRDGRGQDRPVNCTGVTNEQDPLSGNLRGLTHHTVR